MVNHAENIILNTSLFGMLVVDLATCLHESYAAISYFDPSRSLIKKRGTVSENCSISSSFKGQLSIRAVELLDQRNIFQLSADKFNTFFNDDVEAIIATRDIRDELKMLINITGLQLSALARLPHGTCRANILEFQQSLERMVAETKEVEEMLAKALEIKQSIISLQQNKISLQQNRIVLTFTIVTVVFLPLGFISSVFGMNATEWNPDSPWGIRTMFMYMANQLGDKLDVCFVVILSSPVKQIENQIQLQRSEGEEEVFGRGTPKMK
ncbi:hypothetical protein E8E14_012165 [Neopestalotiopsis sp. 37M]|nr:hypothetical protein E8E14_012165 [Neopestalotiopsis sp. 37M]